MTEGLFFTTRLLIALIAILHFYFLYFEMFAWEKRGPRVFKSFPSDLFPSTKALAANLGLYNGFLALGLSWTFLISMPSWQENISIFFLACAAIAGIYGAFSAERRIFFVQALPAIIALILIFIN